MAEEVRADRLHLSEHDKARMRGQDVWDTAHPEERRCSTCDAVLSRYNHWPRCRPCRFDEHRRRFNETRYTS